MGSFSSKKAKSRVTQQDKAVLQLKQQRDKLKQYQKRIELQLDKDKELARQLIKDGKKERALLLLRKKRFQEQQLSKADGMLENIEKMTQDIEFAQVEIKVLDGLKAGNVALKQLNDVLSIDEIEKIMDETKESIEKQREIDAILVGNLSEEDEEACMDELNEILGITDGEEIADQLPDVPFEDLQGRVEETDRKVREKAKRAKVALEAS